jgi:hypothetical protein
MSEVTEPDTPEQPSQQELQARIDELEQRLADEKAQHESQLTELRINRMVTDSGEKNLLLG